MDIKNSLALKKKRELLGTINKRKMSLRKHIDSLKQNDCRLDITQITKYVFLGSLCLKPVPQLFDSPVLLEELDTKVGNVKSTDVSMINENFDKLSVIKDDQKPAKKKNTKKKCLNLPARVKKKSLRERNESKNICNNLNELKNDNLQLDIDKFVMKVNSTPVKRKREKKAAKSEKINGLVNMNQKQNNTLEKNLQSIHTARNNISNNNIPSSDIGETPIPEIVFVKKTDDLQNLIPKEDLLEIESLNQNDLTESEDEVININTISSEINQTSHIEISRLDNLNKKPISASSDENFLNRNSTKTRIMLRKIDKLQNLIPNDDMLELEVLNANDLNDYEDQITNTASSEINKSSITEVHRIDNSNEKPTIITPEEIFLPINPTVNIKKVDKLQNLIPEEDLFELEIVSQHDVNEYNEITNIKETNITTNNNAIEENINSVSSLDDRSLTPELLLSDSDDDTIDQLMFNIMDIKIGPNVLEKDFFDLPSSNLKEYDEYSLKADSSSEQVLPNDKKIIKRTPKCKFCSQVFPNYIKLRKHRLEHDGEKPYRCLKCGENHATLDQHIAHLRTHQGKRPYVCKKCNKSFKTTKALEEHEPVHVLRKVVTPKKIFKCEVCEREFRKLCDLERHTRVHTGEKPSVCNICNRRFQQAHNLHKHLLIHTKEKPFECEICSKRFGRNDVLNRHLLTHSVKKPNRCDICMKTFIRALQLKAHKEKYHPKKNT